MLYINLHTRGYAPVYMRVRVHACVQYTCLRNAHLEIVHDHDHINGLEVKHTLTT